jgi:MFS family permease
MLSASLPKICIPDKWLVMIAVTLGMFLSIVDAAIVIVAIPEIQLKCRADLNAVHWVVTIYMLTQAIVIPIAPYLAKRFGANRA